MQVKWLVQFVCFKDPNFKKTLKSLNIEYKGLIKYADITQKPLEELYDDNDCVVVRCSLGTAAYLRKHAKWIPGLYCDLKNYECTSYYPSFGNYLLNEDYVMLPYGDLLRKRDFLFDKLGKSGTIFVRPNRGSKPFTGQLLYLEKYEDEVKHLGFHNLDQSELCIVAGPANIQREFRWVVVDGEVITGSLYKENYGQPVIKHERIDYLDIRRTQKIVDKVKYQPDRVWVLDTCLTDGEYKVLEINSFSCSGLYECDPKRIIESVNRIALEEWKEYNV